MLRCFKIPEAAIMNWRCLFRHTWLYQTFMTYKMRTVRRCIYCAREEELVPGTFRYRWRKRRL